MLSRRKSDNLELGKRLKQIRKLAELTQEAFGKMVGCTGENISDIERGKSRPSDALLLNICRVFRVTKTWLLEGKSSEQFVRESVEAYYGKNTIDVSDFVPYDIPLLGRAGAGRRVFSEDGYPVGEGYRKVHRPYDLFDPNAFAVEVEGDSMSPRYEDGDIVICSPAKGWTSGDYCVVIKKDDEVLVKKVGDKDGAVILYSTNQAYDPILLNKEEIRAMHKIVWKKER